MTILPFFPNAAARATGSAFALALACLAPAGCAPGPDGTSGGPGDASTAPGDADPGAATTRVPTSLFDGESLGKWEAIDGFAGPGEVRVEDGSLVIDMGETLTGVVWTATDPYELPLINYEISLEARRLDGVDFFCGLTFPIRDLETCCTLVVGGWGGGVVGISSIDGLDASENESGSFHSFEDGVWYRIRLQVQEERFRAWIDDKLVINVITKGRKLGMRFGDIDLSMPLGLTTYQTRAALRNITVRPLADDEIEPGDWSSEY